MNSLKIYMIDAMLGQMSFSVPFREPQLGPCVTVQQSKCSSPWVEALEIQVYFTVTTTFPSMTKDLGQSTTDCCLGNILNSSAQLLVIRVCFCSSVTCWIITCVYQVQILRRKLLNILSILFHFFSQWTQFVVIIDYLKYLNDLFYHILSNTNTFKVLSIENWQNSITPIHFEI